MSAMPRSLLFTPGSRPDRFLKALASRADAVILDLEDAVQERDKPTARGHVLDFLASQPDQAHRIVVRINATDRLCGIRDLVALAGSQTAPFCILLPKAEIATDVTAVCRVLDDAQSSARVAALVESARGVSAAAELARAHPRLAFLMFGAADYAADLGQQVGAFRPDHARATIVNAAAGGEIVAIDSPFFAIDLPEELSAECLDSRWLGFHGKAAIHPAQIEAIAQAYGPTAAERDKAQQIIDAAPQGVGIVDGKMVDVAMIRWARRIVSDVV